MKLSLEACSQIATLVESKRDLCSLCRTCKSFQLAAERALYHTLRLEDPDAAMTVFRLLATQPRIVPLVVVLTLSLLDDEDASEYETLPPLPTDFWNTVSEGLSRLSSLRYLEININDGSDPANAWCLHPNSFQLHAFRCDLSWDASLCTFLLSQNSLSDLYVADFDEETLENAELVPRSLRQAQSLPILRILECTFAEAVGVLVPGRPVTHVKTCFSRSDVAAKRAEMALLMANLRLATRPLLSLNVADSSYTSEFALELLDTVVEAVSSEVALRYMGVLVLPVDGAEVRPRSSF